MHVQHCDITYDVTALFNDVTSTNKMKCFGCTMSEACLPKMAVNDGGNAATAHPECQVFRAMPHMYITQVILHLHVTLME